MVARAALDLVRVVAVKPVMSSSPPQSFSSLLEDARKEVRKRAGGMYKRKGRDLKGT